MNRWTIFESTFLFEILYFLKKNTNISFVYEHFLKCMNFFRIHEHFLTQQTFFGSLNFFKNWGTNFKFCIVFTFCEQFLKFDRHFFQIPEYVLNTRSSFFKIMNMILLSDYFFQIINFLIICEQFYKYTNIFWIPETLWFLKKMNSHTFYAFSNIFLKLTTFEIWKSRINWKKEENRMRKEKTKKYIKRKT